MISTVIVTGANGFLGQVLLDQITQQRPEMQVITILSDRAGGVDLAAETASEWLSANVTLADPSSVLLIHAAAVVEWNAPAGLLGNAAMALHVAQWIQSVGIRFSVLASSVSVYPVVPSANVDTPCDPPNLYGLGKLAAERVWQLCIPADRQAIVRLAGLWGWQLQPTLFWNRLMLAAARGLPAEPRPVVRRRNSRRNYISVSDAASCLLELGMSQTPGLFLAAGRGAVNTGAFVEAVSALPGSRLEVAWLDDHGSDESLYEPSPELLPMLRPFEETLARLWKERPMWVSQG